MIFLTHRKPQATRATHEQIALHNHRRAFFGERMYHNPDKARPVEIASVLTLTALALIKWYLIVH